MDEVIKEFAISGRGVDTEDTRANRIREEIVERFVIEAKCSMNTPNMVTDWPIWMEPLTLVIVRPCEVNARVEWDEMIHLVWNHGM